jgi:hypothetical protein
MTAVSVLVPYRGDGGGPRDQGWAYVFRWWTERHPGYRIIVGTDSGEGPWCKATAVANALSLTDPGDILVIADADVMSDGVGDAVAAITTGPSTWAVPHTRVNRLTPDTTQALYRGATLPEQPPFRRHMPNERPRGSSPEVAETYTGLIGGGLVVLPRALYERVPLDPRFLGWGQEDISWGYALRVIAGEPWRSRESLWHLHHPPQDRPKRGTLAGAGSEDSMALFNRYLRADTPTLMMELLAEFR